MRRSVLVVVVAFAAVAGGVGSLVGSAGASAPRAHAAIVVCPLRAGPAIVTCCGPIVAQTSATRETGTSGPTGPTGITSPCCCCGAEPAICCCCGVGPQPQLVPTFCCPPTAMCAQPLPTISSSPNPSTEAGAVTISGEVSTGGTGVTGVTLWQELPWQRSYRQIAQTSAKSGSYSFSIQGATTNRLWYVTNGSAKSAVDTQGVDAKVTASDSAGTAGRVTVSGAVTPSHVGARVLVERESGTQWSVIGRARIGRGSRYAVHVRVNGTPATLRVELPASRMNAESFSQNLSV